MTATEVPETDEIAVEVNNWEFIDRIPTRAEVMALLMTLPNVWGTVPAEYAEFVQGLPSKKKVKVDKEMENGKVAKVDEYHDVYTLYVGVAGRIKMLNDAAEKNTWHVSLKPDDSLTPAGFVELAERIVYREFCEIATIDDEGVLTPLGKKSGTAWVPSKGGQNAAGSNPFEKVETSARGRAIAAWGFGVLPGSGVASLEEMLGAPELRRAMQAERVLVEKSRPELIDEVYTTAEELRQIRGIDASEMLGRVAKYVRDTFGKEIATLGEDDETIVGIEWEGVKDGQVQLRSRVIATA